MLMVTLKDIRDAVPCRTGWITLLRERGHCKGAGTWGQLDECTERISCTAVWTDEFPMSDVVKSNGVLNALWVMCELDPDAAYEFMAGLVKPLAHLLEHNKVREWLETGEGQREAEAQIVSEYLGHPTTGAVGMVYWAYCAIEHIFGCDYCSYSAALDCLYCMDSSRYVDTEVCHDLIKFMDEYT